MANSVWNIIENVSYLQKEDAYTAEQINGEYAPYIVNKSLSYHADSLIYANEMNQRHSIDRDLQYQFYLNILRPRKRFSRWAKRDDTDKLKVVMETYNYSADKASKVLDLITNEQIDEIKHRAERCTGGVE